MTAKLRKRSSGRKRTWTLATLYRGTDYVLSFDKSKRSWGVVAIDR
jgi:hypothetical protein